MAEQKTMTGGRAVMYVGDTPIGWWASCTWSSPLGALAIHTLGRPYPREIAITHAEAVSLQLGGYKPITGSDASAVYLGPFQATADGGFIIPPVGLLNEFFSNTDHTLNVHDLINGNLLFSVVGFRATGHSSGFNAKGVQEVQIQGQGIAMIDDSGRAEDLPTPGDFAVT